MRRAPSADLGVALVTLSMSLVAHRLLISVRQSPRRQIGRSSGETTLALLDVRCSQPVSGNLHSVLKRSNTFPIGRIREFRSIKHNAWNIEGSSSHPINRRCTPYSSRYL